MADRRPLPPTVRPEMAGWLAARRHGVPASMVAAVAERRAAGDWGGACGAARVDVEFDLYRVARRYGREIADAVEDDLLHLVPDLVRWHLPRRTADGSGLFEPNLVVPLARYGTGADAVILAVRTPRGPFANQRLRLTLSQAREPGTARPREHWKNDRFRWDARCTADLLHRLGGGDRAPFHHRDGRRLTDAQLPTSDPGPVDPVAHTEWITMLQDAGRTVEAWAAAGVEADFTVPAEVRGPPPRLDIESGAALTGLLPLMRERARHSPIHWVLSRFNSSWSRPAQIRLGVTGSRVTARVGAADPGRTPVPLSWWRRSPDLELLRFGYLGPAELHPLVRAALFPHHPRTGEYRPAPGPDPTRPVPVRCGGEWHHVGWRPDGLAALSHTDDEIRREQTLTALGGDPVGCFALARTWRAAEGRLPRPLRELRRWLNTAGLHGNADELERALAAGVDPVGVQGERSERTLLHRAGNLDRPELVPVLVAAGVGLESRDDYFRKPLAAAISAGARPPVVQALLDAGADATDPYISVSDSPYATAVQSVLTKAKTTKRRTQR